MSCVTFYSMSENWDEVCERRAEDVIKHELKLAKDKILRAVKVWENPETPLRAPEMIGPFVIHCLTFIIYKSFLDDPAQTQSSFLLYIIGLLVLTAVLKIVGKSRMATLSIAQIFSIMSYSQVYYIPFGLLARIPDSTFLRILLSLPAFAVQPVSALRLSYMMVPGDSEIFYGGCHMLCGLFMVIWIALH